MNTPECIFRDELVRQLAVDTLAAASAVVASLPGSRVAVGWTDGGAWLKVRFDGDLSDYGHRGETFADPGTPRAQIESELRAEVLDCFGDERLRRAKPPRVADCA